jgi:hypothetical protein
MRIALARARTNAVTGFHGDAVGFRALVIGADRCWRFEKTRSAILRRQTLGLSFQLSNHQVSPKVTISDGLVQEKESHARCSVLRRDNLLHLRIGEYGTVAAIRITKVISPSVSKPTRMA